MSLVTVIVCMLALAQAVPAQGQQQQLVNGYSELEGRIEVWCGGTWKAVCLKYIDQSIANNLCLSFGFSDKNATIIDAASFGSSTTVSLASDTRCSERSEGTDVCGHAGLKCNPLQCREWDISLENSSTGSLVKICINNSWNYVQYCPSNETSSVICRLAGFSAYGSYSVGIVPANQQQISTLNCLGNESHLSLCPQESCGTGMASQIVCKPHCHLCNEVKFSLLSAQQSGSSIQLSWSISLSSYSYLIASCNSTKRQDGVPLHSINEVILSNLSSSVRINGVKVGHDYLCCVNVRTRQHHYARYTACSEAVPTSGTFELPGTVGTIFFYLFAATISILIVVGTIIIAISVYFRVRRKTIKRNKITEKITADLNKVLSQSLLSINEKKKRDKDNCMLAPLKKNNNTKSMDSLHASLKVAKVSTAKVDEEEFQEYSIPNEKRMEKLTPCVAYGAVPPEKTGQQIMDNRNTEQPPLKSRSKADAPVQYYEDVP